MEKETGSDKESERSKAFRRNIAGLTQEALTYFAQRQMVRNSAGCNSQREWGLFLSQTDGLCLAAQKMMNIWQYDIYHNAGFNLSPRGEAMMWERIFKYEPKEALNEEAQALVAANPQLLSRALKAAEK